MPNAANDGQLEKQAMMAAEGKRTFFRQSGWLVIANTLCGFCMAAVHPFASAMPKEEYGVFYALLRVFTVLTIPAAGLQVLFAEQAASAVNEHKQRELATTARAMLLGTFALWLVVMLAAWVLRDTVLETLQIAHPGALWVTLAVALAALWLPVWQGILQGLQNFAWLGWSMICNGVGRVGTIAVLIVVLHQQSTGAMTGALIGYASAVLVAFWPLRRFLKMPREQFGWRRWFRRALPLTLGVGATLFLMNADVLAVQSYFPGDVTPFYSAAAMIGVALVIFTTPLAAVMFPKIVRSLVLAQKSNALLLALAATLALGAIAALVCTAFPELPLRIMYIKNPQFLRSAPLVRWFVWSMLPVTLSNLLIVNLLARSRFAVVPWAVAVASAYGISLLVLVHSSVEVEPFVAFRRVIQLLGGYSVALLAVAAWFTRVDMRS